MAAVSWNVAIALYLSSKFLQNGFQYDCMPFKIDLVRLLNWWYIICHKILNHERIDFLFEIFIVKRYCTNIRAVVHISGGLAIGAGRAINGSVVLHLSSKFLVHFNNLLNTFMFQSLNKVFMLVVQS